ncbi:MAG: TlpA family protein disulfide reductase [Kiritimatiellaeota bacterium]|nr:TlpA family protein disulfide reductase [Kiritimatiellota bacterium]
MTRVLAKWPAAIGLACGLLGCSHLPTWFLKAPPNRGDTFPSVVLEAPSDPSARTYLGLKPGATTFAVQDIRADMVIIEVLDMYCRFCQQGAPAANELRKMLESRGVADRVKMIGIAIGNSRFEAALFADRFRVRFPVVPDPDSTVRHALGRVGTPAFYAVRITDGNAVIVARHNGLPKHDDTARFLDRALSRAGLRTP